MKTCVACAEEIQEAAKLCRFCGTKQDDPDFTASTDTSDVQNDHEGSAEAHVINAADGRMQNFDDNREERESSRPRSQRKRTVGGGLAALAIVGGMLTISILGNGPLSSYFDAELTKEAAFDLILTPDDVDRSDAASIPISDINLEEFLPSTCPGSSKFREAVANGEVLAIGGVQTTSLDDPGFTIQQHIFRQDEEMLIEASEVLAAAPSRSTCGWEDERKYVTWEMTLSDARPVSQQYGVDLGGTIIQKTILTTDNQDGMITWAGTYTFIFAFHGDYAMAVHYWSRDLPSTTATVRQLIHDFAGVWDLK